MIIYVDDILVYSKNESYHMGYSKVVLQVLKEHQLFSKYSNCEFWLRLVAFLCYIIYTDSVEVDRKKMAAVRNRPRPFDPTYIRIFYGLTR